MLRVAQWLYGLAGALLFITAHAAPLKLGRYELQFDVRQHGVTIGEVTERFTLTPKSYTLSSVTVGKGIYRLMGERSLRSQGQVISQRMRPTQFESHQSKRPEKALLSRFDWKKKQLSMQNKDTQTSAQLSANTQDLLSVMYCWMLQPPVLGQLRLPVTNGKKLAMHTFTVSEEANPLTTEAGSFRVIKIDDSEGEKTLYLAKDQHYLPVKLVLHDDGKDIEQVITHISGP